MDQGNLEEHLKMARQFGRRTLEQFVSFVDEKRARKEQQLVDIVKIARRKSQDFDQPEEEQVWQAEAIKRLQDRDQRLKEFRKMAQHDLDKIYDDEGGYLQWITSG